MTTAIMKNIMTARRSSSLLLTRRMVVGTSSTTGGSSTHLTMSSSSSSSSSLIQQQQRLKGHAFTSQRAFSSYSSLSDPEPKLFPTDLKKKKEELHFADDVYLRNDVKFMGALLGKCIREHDGPDMFQKVETLRSLAKEWREHHDQNEQVRTPKTAIKSKEEEEDFQQMVTFVEGLTDQELFVISRAFTHFLSICNAAEAHHRSRRVWEELLERSSKQATEGIRALRNSHDSCGRIFRDLKEKNPNLSTKELYESLLNQQVEFVLTAHPTEVNRRTLLDKRKRVQNLLADADMVRAMGSATPYMQSSLEDKIEREIGNIWQTDELFLSKPSVQQEAQKGTLVIETTLWDAVPQFLRKLDKIMMHDLGSDEYGLPLDEEAFEKGHMAPLKFSSWMGGDRDGNPNVTPQVTREVCLANRIKAAQLYIDDLKEIQSRLSIKNCAKEIRDIVGPESRAPYRAYCQKIINKMMATEANAQAQLDALTGKNTSTSSLNKSSSSMYTSAKEFHSDVYKVHKALCDTKNEVIADGYVTDLLRKIAVFGLSLCPLDIRQESDRHTEALDCITKYLGIGSYAEWDESKRLEWLEEQLQNKRPLLRAGEWNKSSEIFTPTAIDTLETFQMISEQASDSLGAYVISQAGSASDVLAVLLLQKDAGVSNPLRVAPLFETLDDLEGAPEAVERLFSIPTYKEHIAGKQEIMIGYSDSAKDAGRLAASWAQYKTQEALVEVATKHGIELTFFHGKGGTVGRGGNPETFKAILAHAPNTIKGQFRVTEQGEMIDKNFGVLSRAERTLDIYTAAVLAEQFTSRKTPTDEWRTLMEELSEVSCSAYRQVVRQDERFVPYFRMATPELELGSMNIGSRPAKRKATGGVESLRAIPWIFAWMQTRLNLPVWLGVGEALQKMLNDPVKSEKLRDMYKKFTSFQTTIDLVEMVLAKSEPKIAQHYDQMLVTNDPLAKELGDELRTKHYQETEDYVLKLTNHSVLGENNAVLRRALSVRNPYVDALNIMQAETLKRVRERDGADDSPALKDALRTTITGIANGMGNTG